MTVESWRGNAIIEAPAGWVYAADGVLVSSDKERACGHCGLDNTPEGHDGCIGTLPGVLNACCGHGDDPCAYVEMEGGVLISGAYALVLISELKEGDDDDQ